MLRNVHCIEIHVSICNICNHTQLPQGGGITCSPVGINFIWKAVLLIQYNCEATFTELCLIQIHIVTHLPLSQAIYIHLWVCHQSPWPLQSCMSMKYEGKRGQDALLNITPTAAIVHLVLWDTYSVYIVVNICNVCWKFWKQMSFYYMVHHQPHAGYTAENCVWIPNWVQLY